DDPRKTGACRCARDPAPPRSRERERLDDATACKPEEGRVAESSCGIDMSVIDIGHEVAGMPGPALSPDAQSGPDAAVDAIRRDDQLRPDRAAREVHACRTSTVVDAEHRCAAANVPQVCVE